MSRRLALAALLCTAAGAASAGTDVSLDQCDLATGWSVSMAQDELAFSREGASAPARIELIDGRLRVDGREVVLSADDRRRLREYEDTVRALLPEAQAIALEAIEIAFAAVDEVARMFAPKDEAGYAATAEKLATARIIARRKIEDAFAGRGWSDAEMERLVEDAVAQLVPALVGDIVGTAVKVALSGDEAAAKELEARAERMEREIEARVEGRAKALEKRAEAFCPRLVALDRLESDIAAEIAPGQRFDLIRVSE
jgi:hypothetical protein